MRKIVLEQDNVKSMINGLLGVKVRLLVNRGRKKIEKYNGTLLAAYPAIFTFRAEDEGASQIMTYSYSDVVCGDVKIKSV